METKQTTEQAVGPWLIDHYHAECDNRPARVVSRRGVNGWPECLTVDGEVTLGGAGPLYCFPNEAAARAAIENAQEESFLRVERKVEALLARRVEMNASGQAGEDVALIRAAFGSAA